jgi:hypothetical protein
MYLIKLCGRDSRFSARLINACPSPTVVPVTIYGAITPGLVALPVRQACVAALNMLPDVTSGL